MIRTYATLGLLLALLATGWWGQVQRGRAVQAEAALQGAQAQLAQVAEANAVHRAAIARMERDKAKQAALAAEFDTMEGGDAPLSDYLRTVDGRLR